MDLTASARKGLASGLRVLWELAKVIIPAVMVVHVLDRTGALLVLSQWLGPVMGIFGLPGESALVLVTANFVSFYAGLATIVALALPFKETTILAAMMMINHSAISETALVTRAGARGSWVLAIRTVAMVVVGLVLNWTMP
ncbi:MAG: nucleoside recognition domain-containing protein [Bacillota bacterium]